MRTDYGYFANYGFIRTTIPQELSEQLRQEIDQIPHTSTTIDNKLAGNIQRQYLLSKHGASLRDFVCVQCERYSEHWPKQYTRQDLGTDNLELQDYWCNIQYKHEFNPMHDHWGTWSFVTWLSVPYYIQQELAEPQCVYSRTPRAGMFSFVYTNIFGEVCEAEFHVDKTWENEMLIFPSKLQHMVYPFYTSDEPRISVSGNLINRPRQ